MKYTYITLATVAMATALFSSSNHHVQAGLPRLLKRAETALSIADCVKEVFLNRDFKTQKCSDMFRIPDIIKPVTSIELSYLNLDFNDESGYVVLSSPEINVGVMKVLNLPIPITGTRQNIILVDNGIEIATFNTPWVTGEMKGDTLVASVGKSVLNIKPDKHEEFSKFIAALTVNPKHTFILKGTVDIELTISLATLTNLQTGITAPLANSGPSITFTVSGIAFSSPITLTGFNNFPDIEFVEELSNTLNDDGSFTIISKVNIKNTSQLGVKMGDVYLKSFEDGSNDSFGETLLKELDLKCGDNFITVETTSTIPGMAAKEIYNRMAEKGDKFQFKGFAGSSKVDTVLAHGLSTIVTTVAIPPLGKPASAAPAAPAAPEPEPAF